MNNFSLFQAGRIARLMFFLVQSAFLLLLLPTSSFAALGNEALFTECLDLQSNPRYPTSQVTYSQHNSSFTSVLQEYARNIRFLKPEIRKPSFIVTPKHVSNIVATIQCCKTHFFEMRIRSGGHDMEGLSFTSNVPFVVLDMFNLRAINVNLEEETAWVEAGAQLGEVYYKIAEKSSIYAFPGGVCPTVGVAGHLSGGGYGNLMRKYGLSTDHVIDATVVNANGMVLDREAMGEDMFWALRGGGAASFGVILAFKVQLVRVPPVVTVFQVARSLEQGASRTMYRWQEVAPNLPKDLFLRARVSVIKDQKEGSNRLAFTFIALFLGESKELQDLLTKSFPELGISAKDCQEMPWINSTLFWDEFPSGTSTEILLSREYERLSRKVKSDYVTKPIPQEGLELMWKELLNMDGLVMEWNPYGGRMSEILANEIVFYHRAGNLFKIEYDFKWYEEGKEAEEHHIELSRRLYKFMTPYVSNSPREAFYNYRDLDLGTNTGRFAKTRAEFGSKYHGGNFQRLLKVKLKVDPLNFFRDEQSIPPILNLT
ncbi:berberine bridge enzyme-like 7 [Chenopodium quinoa]|uniref:berberine bridge enzyme-like 7 n=1 Tax=Chenopodium quinoa TaxID=63459 RepID=UPI000B795DB6|nr:berberine bridge enzyme-like 7 [Chenopodium quinoa]